MADDARAAPRSLSRPRQGPHRGPAGPDPLAAGYVPAGDDGWFRLGNLKLSERTLTAAAAVDLMNNPQFRIDRATGAIRIRGAAGSYDGVCQSGLTS